MVSLRTLGTEFAALGTAALSLPLRPLVHRPRFAPDAPHPTPVVFVHGFLGDPTNFLVLRAYLGAHGLGSFASFGYRPRLDYQRLASRLGRMIESLCEQSGSPVVDVVGHSLGGLIGRYLVETEVRAPVRRLVTLGAPYFATPMPSREYAVFAAADPFVPAPQYVHGPHAPHLGPEGRVHIVRHCGHWGLLYHPGVLREVERYLRAPDELAQAPTVRLALAAS